MIKILYFLIITNSVYIHVIRAKESLHYNKYLITHDVKKQVP
jgi:hypothetical protein